MRFYLKFATILAIAGAPAFGQSDSRLAEIAAQQEQKASQVKVDEPTKLERGFLWFQNRNPFQRFSAGVGGFHARIGGMGPGTGFGVGPGYQTDLLNGRLSLNAGAQASFHGDRKFDVDLSAPRLGGGRYFVDFYAVHHEFPRLNYYGPGPQSEATGRTDYRLEDTALDATFGIRPFKRLTLAASGGYVFNNVGNGTDPRFASIEQVYSPAQAPGLDVQVNHFRSGGYLQYDWRDNADGPRRGGNYFAQFSDYRDRTFGLANFRRLDVEAQQYIPVLNSRRVFAVRGRSTLTYANEGAPIPFYMQPSLGGAEDLRGYRPFRFRGDNLMLMSAEYRWEVFSGLDMALFGDAGQVFQNKSGFAWRGLESDAGFGFRFNARNKTFLRLDVGFSHEGFQVWVKFNNVFKKGPIHTSSSMGDF